MYAEVFSSRLKQAREYNGYTQADVANTLKMTQSAYGKYETGMREPNLETLAMLSKLYEVKSDWLIGLSADSGLSAIAQVIQEREREKMLKKLEKEAEMQKRAWG